MRAIFRVLFSLALMFATILTIQACIPDPHGVTWGLLIFTAPGGAATPFAWNMNYIPQFISFDNTVPLTSLRIETAEDGVLHDFTAAGMVAVSYWGCVGIPTANTLLLRLADGELRPKNVTISGVTSGAGAVPFFVSSEKIGKLPFMTKNAAILANNPTTFTKFSMLFIPTMATVTDRADVTFNDGHQQTFALEDLTNLSPIYQEAAGAIVNNSVAYIDKVIVTCAAATPAYVVSVKLPGQ